MSRDCCVALPHDATGLSAFFVVFPDHIHLLFLKVSASQNILPKFEKIIQHTVLDFKQIEESFIGKQINKLSSKKATGQDGISAKLLKFAKPVVLQPIT